MSYYAILGIPVSSTPKEMKDAFKALSLRMHPDRCHEHLLENEFKNVTLAYRVLSDPLERRKYHGRMKIPFLEVVDLCEAEYPTPEEAQHPPEEDAREKEELTPEVNKMKLNMEILKAHEKKDKLEQEILGLLQQKDNIVSSCTNEQIARRAEQEAMNNKIREDTAIVLQKAAELDRREKDMDTREKEIQHNHANVIRAEDNVKARTEKCRRAEKRQEMRKDKLDRRECSMTAQYSTLERDVISNDAKCLEIMKTKIEYQEFKLIDMTSSITMLSTKQALRKRKMESGNIEIKKRRAAEMVITDSISALERQALPLRVHCRPVLSAASTEDGSTPNSA